METHDIRYLNDNNAKPTKKEKRLFFSRFSSVQFFGMLSLVVLLLATTTTVILLSQRTSATSSAKTPPNMPAVVKDDDNTEVQEDVAVKGTVVCVSATTPVPGKSCELGIKESSGAVYGLANIKYDDVANGVIKPGKQVTVSGNVIKTKSSSSGTQNNTNGTVFVSSVNNSGGASGGGSGGGGGSTSSDPTPTATIIPTPTPYPYTAPLPGVSYVTVKYIVDNQNSLSGKDVPLGAIIVSVVPLEQECGEEDSCNEVHYIVNDASGSSRDTAYDTLMITNTSEAGDVLFSPGQKIYGVVRVSILEGKLTLLFSIVD